MLEVMGMQEIEGTEVVLNVRLKPAVDGRGWSACVEGADPESKIRFQDLKALIRYLQALSEARPSRGLR